MNNWEEYPIGTKVYAIGGGYWEKTSRGWKWCTGSTFPTPGADWYSILVPFAVKQYRQIFWK